MITALIAAARAAAANRTPPPGRGRQFFLEKEPLPKVLPGQEYDDVQLLVADGPGDAESVREYWIGDRVRVISDPPDEAWTRYIGAVVSKSGLHGTDAHEYGVLFDDEHETVLHFWTPQLEPAPEDLSDLTLPGGDGLLLPEAFQDGREPSPAEVAVWHARWRAALRAAGGADRVSYAPVEPSAYAAGELRGPTPLADDLRADREGLLAANGRQAARIRALEGQLRAARIEPAARE